MKKTLKISGMMMILIASFLFSNISVFAQDEPESVPEEQPKERPARPAFESGIIFDDASTTIQPSNTLEMVIQHRFGVMQNGIEDLYGIWAPSNIRLGVNYSILNNLMIGFGTTKFNKLQDFQAKYNVIQQTRSGSIPVTVSVYEIVAINGMHKDNFGVNYKFSNRMSYFTQVIVSRRFNDNFSLQFAPSFTHYNSLDSLMDHDRFSLSAAARYKFSPQSSIIFSGTWPLYIQSLSEQNKAFNEAQKELGNRVKPNITIGWEISTSTHAFHLYLGSAQNILPQENIMLNKNDFFDGGILLGLNVTRLWGF
jgi:hypothetical protein